MATRYMSVMSSQHSAQTENSSAFAQTVSTFIEDVAGMNTPKRLAPFLHYLSSLLSEDLIDPHHPSLPHLHPFLIPLSINKERSTIRGLLRHPRPQNAGDLPVVEMDLIGGRGLTLIADSVDSLIHRVLATADANNEALPAAFVEAANKPYILYPPKKISSTNRTLDAYLVTEVGGFPDLYQTLTERHLAKKNYDSALVTVDRLCNKYPGWGHPLVYRAEVMQQLGREPEARDSARAALCHPLWTLGGSSFGKLAEMAGWKDISSNPFKTIFADPNRPPSDKASCLMDIVFTEGAKWDSCRAELIELYTLAQNSSMVKFLSYTPPS